LGLLSNLALGIFSKIFAAKVDFPDAGIPSINIIFAENNILEKENRHKIVNSRRNITIIHTFESYDLDRCKIVK
jgi:hypothetical protein